MLTEATWWQPCLYSVCYHTPPATYPRTLVGPTFPEHHRISFTRRLATRKPIRPFGASSYLVLLRVMLALPSMSPWMRWALTPPFHPYPGTPFTVEQRIPWRFVFCGAHVGSLRLGVTQHPALWSPDFPLTGKPQARRAAT